MRDLNIHNALRLRTQEVYDLWGWFGDGTCGAFIFPSPIDKASLKVIASTGMGWEHVSVSRQNRCPNWPEMSYIKRMFFKDDETAMELHVAVSEHINYHPNCLHLWRPNDGQKIPLPPLELVGPIRQK